MEARGIVKAFRKVKRIGHQLEKEEEPQNKKQQKELVTGTWLNGICAYIIQTGIGNARATIFQTQIVQNGGQVVDTFSPCVTHVIVDDSMNYDRALRLLKVDKLPPAVQLVKCSWLSLCITEKKLLNTAGYSVFIPDRHLDSNHEQVKVNSLNGNESALGINVQQTNNKQKTEKEATVSKTVPIEESASLNTIISSHRAQTSDDDGSDTDEAGVSQKDLEALLTGCYPTTEEPSPAQPDPVTGKWVCAQSSKAKNDNHNRHITDKLEVLAKAYTHQGDKWRALGYSKAINALKSYHKPVSSYEEACKIRGIGKRMAEKIKEILESGNLRKLDHIGESVPVLELFTNIWGVGSKTAQMWYQQGFRTLEDIRTKAALTSQQVIGLKHYDDFLDRMPREEAAEIEKTVKEAALSLNPGLLAVACGSYRRGKPTCGDVDILITHPDGKSHKGIFSKILHILHQSGFLTDDLVSHEENGEQKKYLGVCRLPGPESRHRRLDIIVVPYSEFACAILYFTGSAHFNRSMRALAKTKNMSLSEHSLNKDVLRQGSLKVSTGAPLPTPTEKDVFRHLGLPYREPQDRDW
ncbi:DNA polymerase lambda isoform X1 [Lepisosteus oculatus]|uniref:DNA polymerase lambda isoform X1 n=1 Tax=Lepisosteus oculatus TaxID=7918 RepID=UPI00370FE80F